MTTEKWGHLEILLALAESCTGESLQIVQVKPCCGPPPPSYSRPDAVSLGKAKEQGTPSQQSLCPRHIPACFQIPGAQVWSAGTTLVVDSKPSTQILTIYLRKLKVHFAFEQKSFMFIRNFSKILNAAVAFLTVYVFAGD